MNAKLVATLLIVLLAAGIGVVVGITASGDDGPRNAPMPAQIVTVSGGASVQTEPDKATVSLAVNTEAASAEEALQANAGKSDAVMKSLESSGVAEDDIQTTNVRLDKRYTDRGTPRETVTFVANNEFTVIIRELPKVGEIIDGAVSAGANDVHGVEFGLSSETAAKSAALEKAVANARVKAETLAKAAGAELGPVVRIDEERYDVNPYAYRSADMFGQTTGAAATAPMPVAPGQVETTVAVQVIFELEP